MKKCNNDVVQFVGKNYYIKLQQFNNSSKTMIILKYGDTEDKKIFISDTLNSKFERIRIPLSHWVIDGNYDIIYFATLKEVPTSDYVILLMVKCIRFSSKYYRVFGLFSLF